MPTVPFDIDVVRMLDRRTHERLFIAESFERARDKRRIASTQIIINTIHRYVTYVQMVRPYLWHRCRTDAWTVEHTSACSSPYRSKKATASSSVCIASAKSPIQNIQTIPSQTIHAYYMCTFDIDVVQMLDRRTHERLFVAVSFESDREQPILLPPITQIIVTDDRVTEWLVRVDEKITFSPWANKKNQKTKNKNER